MAQANVVVAEPGFSSRGLIPSQPPEREHDGSTPFTPQSPLLTITTFILIISTKSLPARGWEDPFIPNIFPSYPLAMSPQMSTDQQQQPATSPPRSDSSSPATPTGGTAKRNLFGRKKKSATSLGPSPSGSTNNLVSAGNSLKSGQSVESLQDKAGLATSEGPGGKGIMSVFKRKGGKSIGDIEEDQEREAAERDDDIEQGKEMASEDDGVLSYDSETDV